MERPRYGRIPMPLVMLAAAGILGVSACSSANKGHVPRLQDLRSTPAQTAANSEVTVTVHLDHTEVRAGQPITGVATVDNRTGHPLHLPNGTCDGWLYTGLSNSTIPETALDPLVACAPADLAVGVSTYRITVSTTFTGCAQTPGDSKISLPACLGPMHDEMPPLPAGIYHSFTSVSPPLNVANSVKVRLTSANS